MMKATAIFTIALLGWESASLTLPVRELELAAKNSLPLSEGAEFPSLEPVNTGLPEMHMEKRAAWRRWAPSRQCVRNK